MQGEIKLFRVDLEEEVRDLFASHRTDILLDLTAEFFENYEDEYRLAAAACLIKAIADLRSGKESSDAVESIMLRAKTLTMQLLSTEGWQLAELLEIVAAMLVIVAANAFRWKREDG